MQDQGVSVFERVNAFSRCTTLLAMSTEQDIRDGCACTHLRAIHDRSPRLFGCFHGCVIDWEVLGELVYLWLDQ